MSVAEPLSTKTKSTTLAVKGSDGCINEELWRGRSQRKVPLLASKERIVAPPGPDNKTRPTPTDEMQEFVILGCRLTIPINPEAINGFRFVKQAAPFCLI